MHGYGSSSAAASVPPRIRAGLMMGLLLALCACKPAAEREQPVAFATAEIVAQVNGKPIYDEDVQTEAWARGAIREGETLPKETDLYYQVLEDLIAVKLFAEEAVDRRLDHLSDVRRRIEVVQERVLAGALDEELQNKALTPGAIERFYREQLQLGVQDLARLRESKVI